MKPIVRVCLVALLFLHSALALSQSVEPDAFVEQLVTDLVDAGRDAEGATTGDVLAASVDFVRIAAGVLGTYRTTLSPEQVGEFQDVLKSSFETLIGKALATFDKYEFSIGNVRKAQNRAQVLAVMEPDSGGRYEAVFALAATDESWVAQNLTLNGVNLGLTYRNQFAALMEENSDDFSATLEAWSREVNKTTEIGE